VIDASGYFVDGDWHDVISPPSDVEVNKYFFAVDSFTVIFCPTRTWAVWATCSIRAITVTPLVLRAMLCLGTSTRTATYSTSTCELNVPTSTPTVSPTAEGGAETAEDNDEKSLPVYGWVFVGFAVLFCIVGVIVVGKLFGLGFFGLPRRSNKDDDMADLPGQPMTGIRSPSGSGAINFINNQYTLPPCSYTEYFVVYAAIATRLTAVVHFFNCHRAYSSMYLLLEKVCDFVCL
jgi:hypothetical protein